MKELYLEKPGDLKMIEMAPVPAPMAREVKVKVIYGGICGSDLRVLRGTVPYATYPCRPGHEILGTIVEAGEGSPFKVGTKVVSFPNTYCGTCEFCLQGRTNICANKKARGYLRRLFAQRSLDSDSCTRSFRSCDNPATLSAFCVTSFPEETDISKGNRWPSRLRDLWLLASYFEP
jgi:threonine dehydrogenase-like Zn-dependent dehydrogenase